MNTETKLSWFSSLIIRLRELKNYIKSVFKVEIINQNKEEYESAKYSSCIKD